MDGAKRLISYLIFAGCMVIAYQSYENSRLRPETEALSMRAACDVDGGCVVRDDHPYEQRSDPIRRRYEWRTTTGRVVVTCRRELVFFGEWECRSELGTLSVL